MHQYAHQHRPNSDSFPECQPRNVLLPLETSHHSGSSALHPMDISLITLPGSESPNGSNTQTPQENGEDRQSNPNEPSPTPWYGFKIVGDNLDKSVKPRHMRSDQQTPSLHYFQSYAVRDRVNLSHLSDEPQPVRTCTQVQLKEILPSSSDHKTLFENFDIIVARVLVEHMPFFKENFGDISVKHIPHEYSEEMSQLSTVVSYHVYRIQQKCMAI